MLRARRVRIQPARRRPDGMERRPALDAGERALEGDARVPRRTKRTLVRHLLAIARHHEASDRTPVARTRTREHGLDLGGAVAAREEHDEHVACTRALEPEGLVEGALRHAARAGR